MQTTPLFRRCPGLGIQARQAWRSRQHGSLRRSGAGQASWSGPPSTWLSGSGPSPFATATSPTRGGTARPAGWPSPGTRRRGPTVRRLHPTARADSGTGHHERQRRGRLPGRDLCLHGLRGPMDGRELAGRRRAGGGRGPFHAGGPPGGHVGGGPASRRAAALRVGAARRPRPLPAADHLQPSGQAGGGRVPKAGSWPRSRARPTSASRGTARSAAAASTRRAGPGTGAWPQPTRADGRPPARPSDGCSGPTRRAAAGPTGRPATETAPRSPTASPLDGVLH